MRKKGHGNAVNTTMTTACSSLWVLPVCWVWWLVRDWPCKISAFGGARTRACCACCCLFVLQDQYNTKDTPIPPTTHTHTQSTGTSLRPNHLACLVLLLLGSRIPEPFIDTLSHPPASLAHTIYRPLRDVSVPLFLPAARVPSSSSSTSNSSSSCPRPSPSSSPPP